MAWNFNPLINWVSAPRNPAAADLDNIAKDLRTWGGNVDAASYNLANLGVLTFAAAGYISGNLGIGVAKPASATNRVQIRVGADNDLYIQNVTDTAVKFNATNAAGAANIPMHFDASRFRFLLSGIPVYANNAAAVAGGLQAGDKYRTGADPDYECIVH